MKIASRLVAWQRQYGRHGLPWQGTRDPYRVWLSEIMLQQTQVAAVIEYYHRFLQKFPDVAALAGASADQVMAQWAGLGYYARARNLHACAKQVVHTWGGVFPGDAASLATLPGIGPSTAAAIASFCFGERVAILDGNVKRVLARLFAVEGDLTTRSIELQLWALAREQIPSARACATDANLMSSYTQGLMDLGATLCTRSRPQCESCPFQTTCAAKSQGRCDELPWPRARKTLPERTVALLVAHRPGHILLTQRPQTGIWGGLWSLPEFDLATDVNLVCQRLGLSAQRAEALAPFLHVFTHYRLTIQPHLVKTAASRKHLTPTKQLQTAHGRPTTEWVSFATLSQRGLPAPVRKLIDGLLQASLIA